MDQQSIEKNLSTARSQNATLELSELLLNVHQSIAMIGIMSLVYPLIYYRTSFICTQIIPLCSIFSFVSLFMMGYLLNHGVIKVGAPS